MAAYIESGFGPVPSRRLGMSLGVDLIIILELNLILLIFCAH